MNTKQTQKRIHPLYLILDRSLYRSQFSFELTIQTPNLCTDRRARVTVQEREAESQNTEDAQTKREAEAEKRKKESHDLVAESIKRELVESTL